ncbi:FN3 associated domain-containing protein [Reichenbachiella versicolor]|uniref:FN3 associated domain-containing protein n=1 Tax=Reichenbachiella versicolor TaxID=1821036 RepID=UPI000D6EA78B|nr:FN3 associated domain-containing protein [Reichenbachiella versicolor]
MEKLERVISATVFCMLSILTLFLVFEDYVQVPIWLQPLGRMHPMILHFPIAFVALLVLLDLFRKQLDESSYRKVNRFLLWLTSLSTIVAVLMGFFLYKEGYDSELMTIHKWTGASIAYLCYLLLLLDAKSWIYKTLLYGSFLNVIVIGHFGAGLTHGTEFILEPVISKESNEIQEETPVFEAVIQPILKSKCQSCHNSEKHKGDLDLSTPKGIAKGGENGLVWIAGNPTESAIIHRAFLPIEDKEHMPPKGKAQLSNPEIELLKVWIQDGANQEQTISELTKGDTLEMLVSNLMNKEKKSSKPAYTFAFADSEVIEELNNSFRNVIQKSPSSPAIEAAIYGKETYTPDLLEELIKVKEQIVDLHLSYLPIGTKGLETISQFENLEVLNLNYTDVTSKELSVLTKCKKLRSLSLAGTNQSEEIEEVISQFESLESVYLWNTPLTKNQVSQIQQQMPALKIAYGYIVTDEEEQQLTPPLLKNKKQILAAGERVQLEHKMKGVEIRYTTDGTKPDSTSINYTKPIKIAGYTNIKAIAYKEGWGRSKVSSYQIFDRGFTPQSVDVLTTPIPRFKGTGGAGLIDGRKGSGNLRRDEWIGFEKDPLIAVADFGNAPPILDKITISFSIVKWQRASPPETVEIWGGDQKENMKLIQKQNFDFKSLNVSRIAELNFDSVSYQYYKVVAKPISKLPSWHMHKGKKGRVLVDQLFFY